MRKIAFTLAFVKNLQRQESQSVSSESFLPLMAYRRTSLPPIERVLRVQSQSRPHSQRDR